MNHTLGGASCPAAVHDEEGVRKWHLGHHHDFSIESFKTMGECYLDHHHLSFYRNQLYKNGTLVIMIIVLKDNNY